MGRFGVPIFVEFREPTREFDVGFRVLEIATAIAEVRFEVSPILRLARPREFFYAGAKPFGPLSSWLRKLANDPLKRAISTGFCTFEG